MQDARNGLADTPHHARGLKAKAASEFRNFLVLFFYLWILFGVFALNQDIVLRKRDIGFTMQGIAVVNALVFAKVMLVFELFDFGKFLRRRPLIFPILFETLLLTVTFVIVHVLETMIVGLLHHKTLAASLPDIGGGGFYGLLSASVIVFFALMPYFGLRNIGLALGHGRLHEILFGTSPRDGAA